MSSIIIYNWIGYELYCIIMIHISVVNISNEFSHQISNDDYWVLSAIKFPSILLSINFNNDVVCIIIIFLKISDSFYIIIWRFEIIPSALLIMGMIITFILIFTYLLILSFNLWFAEIVTQYISTTRKFNILRWIVWSQKNQRNHVFFTILKIVFIPFVCNAESKLFAQLPVNHYSHPVASIFINLLRLCCQINGNVH